MDNKHTGTPYTVSQEGNDFWIMDNDGGVIALTYSETSGTPEANARFIVKACNNIDCIVSALSAIMKIAKHDTPEYKMAKDALGKYEEMP